MRYVNLLFAMLMPVAAAAGDLALIMVEQPGCRWCQKWDAEIAPIWPNSDEGRAAPLRRIQLHAPVPDDLALQGQVLFTPTFILTEDGAERSRLEGYPGEDFFWPIITGMIAEARSGAGVAGSATPVAPTRSPTPETTR